MLLQQKLQTLYHSSQPYYKLRHSHGVVLAKITARKHLKQHNTMQRLFKNAADVNNLKPVAARRKNIITIETVNVRHTAESS